MFMYVWLGLCGANWNFAELMACVMTLLLSLLLLGRRFCAFLVVTTCMSWVPLNAEC